jgi:hypothetical protein
MSNSEHDSKIEQVAKLIVQDNFHLDEYHDFVKTKFHIEGDSAIDLVNEAFLYLKLMNAKDVDPLQDGDKFGAGFS